MPNVNRRLWVSLASLLVTACTHAPSTFDFFVIGDTAYTVPNDYPAYEQLIENINQADPAFTVHIGDTKSGGDSCNDARQQIIKSPFDLFEEALIYTPGDNEWTDCHRPGINEDPNDRLTAIRQIFFPSAFSLGQKPMHLTRQADVSSHALIVENSRWKKRQVMFATIHVVGSNNNHTPPNPTTPPEFDARNAANIEWIQETFDLAKKKKRRAIVFFFHANMFRGPPNASGFVDALAAIEAGAQKYPGQILLVHGDTHTYRVDKPLDSVLGTPPGTPTRFDNVTRLETFGAPDIEAVRVTVDRKDPKIFTITPF